MYLLLRFSPILTSLFVFAVFLFTYLQPAGQISISAVIYLGLFAVLLVSFALIFIGAGYPLKTRLRFLPFLLLTSISAYILFLFTDNSAILWAIMIVLPAIFVLYCKGLKVRVN